MSTRRIDLEELVSTVDARGWSGLPEGTCVGHVHLRVGAIESAERFYTGLLGLDVMLRRPGATFYSSGGYHHHVATNVWNSAGAPPRPANVAGLASFEIVARDAAAWSALAERTDGIATAVPSGLRVQDPWGTTVLLRSPD
jgi:catechol 2,3-dioxygenase